MQLLWDNVFHSFSEVFKNAYYYCGMFSIYIYSIKTNLHSSLKKSIVFLLFCLQLTFTRCLLLKTTTILNTYI